MSLENTPLARLVMHNSTTLRLVTHVTSEHGTDFTLNEEPSSTTAAKLARLIEKFLHPGQKVTVTVVQEEDRKFYRYVVGQ